MSVVLAGSIIGAIIVFFVISIVLMVWVYNDAKKRNMNAAVWLLVVFIGNCVGCCIFLLVREPLQPQTPLYQQAPRLPLQKPPTTTGSNKSCPSCGISLSTDVTFCTGCGLKIK
jgi:hypothetical protein